MSEILAMHRRIVERLSRHNSLCFDSASWPSEGHECPSSIRQFCHRLQLLPCWIGWPGLDCAERRKPRGFGLVPSNRGHPSIQCRQTIQSGKDSGFDTAPQRELRCDNVECSGARESFRRLTPFESNGAIGFPCQELVRNVDGFE